LDISSKMLERAKQKKQNHVIDYVCGDVHSLPFPPAHFAKVIMLSVYPHFDNPLLAMEEVFRILKEGGTIIIVHLKAADAVNNIHASIGGVIANDLLPNEFEMKSVIRRAGFEIEFSEFNNRIALVCRKPIRI